MNPWLVLVLYLALGVAEPPPPPSQDSDVVCPHLAALKRAKRQDAVATPPPTQPPPPPPTPPPVPSSTTNKPENSQWLGNERDPLKKTGLVKWLLNGCVDCAPYPFHHTEYPGYDGFYNNHAHPELGAIDTPLLRRLPAFYEDSVYKPKDPEHRPNPLTLSETFMARPIGSQSRTGKTALLVFFGQQMVEEILDAQRPACPPEYFNIPIPNGHEYRETAPKHTELPLLRTRFDQRTGYSPGNPRQQLNEITPWLDGGLTYGTTKAWSDQLRRFKNGSLAPNGMLAGANDTWLFPEYNTHRLPLANPPPPALHAVWVKQHETANVNRFFRLGNPRGNENPFLLTFGVVWFRWHNVLAREISNSHPNWSSEKVYNEARKWVIASHQQVVMYEWLPIWLGRRLPQYREYNPALDPQIDQLFQSAAMRFGHTLVVPGVFLRDYSERNCALIDQFQVVRTCNFFWRSQEPMLHTFGHGGADQVEQVDIDRLIMGMATQLTEEEDHFVVEDLRGRVFGPLEFSRRDLMAVNIQRARDHGLPDYNTARRAFGLLPVDDENINSILGHVDQQYRDDLRTVYKNYSDHLNDNSRWHEHIDIWIGGMLETKDGPGELFSAIIMDQFIRIRDADRFWFENMQNGLFTFAEISRLKELKFRDILMSVTRMRNDDLQQNPFRAPTVEDMKSMGACSQNTRLVARQLNFQDPLQNNANISQTVRVLPALTTDETTDPAYFVIEPCTTPATYDYFSNSEISYIFTFLGLSTVIGGIGALLVTMHMVKGKRDATKLNSTIPQRLAATLGQCQPFSAREWQSRKEGSRAVILLLKPEKRFVEVCSPFGELLRALDLSHCNRMDILVANDGLHLLLRITNDYDLVLRFDSDFIRQAFLSSLEDLLTSLNVPRERKTSYTLNALYKEAITRESRQKRLEIFFRVVSSQAFKIQHNEEEILNLDTTSAREIIYTELTITEFATALGMRADSEFIRKIFALVDKDKNGFISFREFLDMLILFSKGSAEDKAKLFFDMYDINGTGQLTRDDFKNMLKSLMETAQADVEQEDLENVVTSMMHSAGLTNRDVMRLEDFQRLLSDYRDKIGLANLAIKGISESKGAAKTAEQTSQHKPFPLRARDTAISIYGTVLDYRQGAYEPSASEEPQGTSLDNLENIVLQVKTGSSKKSKRPRWWLQMIKAVENRRLEIFWWTIYTLVLLSIFAERAYYYSVEREHAGLRRIAGYGVTVTRGAASAMMFTYSTLLLTMCRNTITRLRETHLNRFIPFDSFVEMHKYIAAWALLFTVIHSIGHAINFYHISTQTADDLTCLFRNFFHATHELPKFHYWCWQTITGVTGMILAVLTALIFIFALPFARARLFNWFWATHSLYPLYFAIMVLHGCGRLVQPPFFWYFFIGPCVLYVFDSLVTSSRKKIEIPVIKAEILPSNVTMLQFKRPDDFDYRSGQWCRVACLSLNKSEYHPFTIASAPHEPHLTLYIRAVGPWTRNIRRIYDSANRPSKGLSNIYLDGPYGESHQDWFLFDVSVLVGGGIGVTPFASILKDIVHRSQNTKGQVPCKKVYFLWVTKTQKHFEWMVDILRDLENADTGLVVSVHIFVTQFYEKFDLRTILLYICERHFQRVCGRSLFTGLKAMTHFGRPNCEEIFRNLKQRHSQYQKIGVFSCGPSPLIQQVEQACAAVNKEVSDGPLLQHRYENF